MSREDEWVAPHLLLAECTSVLTRYVYQRHVTEARARAVIDLMLHLPIRLVHASALFPRAFEIARLAGWSKACDAVYLSVAEHEAAELLTVDRGMRDAARRLGISATLIT